MKKILLILFIVLSYNDINAQSLCKKGTWMIGLNPIYYTISINESYINYKDGKIISGDTAKSSSGGFALNLGAGYFIKDNLCIGAGFGTSGAQQLVLPTQLFARYYLMRKIHNFSFTQQDNMRRYAFYVQGTISGGYVAVNSSRKTGNIQTAAYSYGGKIAVGYTYMFTKYLAFEMMGMYNYNYSYTNSVRNINSTPVTDVGIYKTSGLTLLFGIQTYF